MFAIDIQPNKLKLAESLGAVAIDSAVEDAVGFLREKTGGKGVDLALELIGLPLTMQECVRSLGIQGRAALVGITDKTFQVAPYQELINREAEIIGVSDHLAAEIPVLLEFARAGKLNFSDVITSTVPLDAKAINDTLDRLDQFSGEDVRTVITP